MNTAQWLQAYNDLSEIDKMDANALIAMGISKECYGLITPSYVWRGIERAIEKSSSLSSDSADCPRCKDGLGGTMKPDKTGSKCDQCGWMELEPSDSEVKK